MTQTGAYETACANRRCCSLVSCTLACIKCLVPMTSDSHCPACPYPCMQPFDCLFDAISKTRSK